MENDLKDSIKKIEEIKKKQEKIEKIIIIVAGIFAVLIFLVIGVNIYYSGGNEPVSQPKVVLEDEVQTNVVEYKPENQIKADTTLPKQNLQEKQQEIKDTKKQQTQTKTVEKEKKQKEKNQNASKTVEETKKQKQTKSVKPAKTKQFYYTVQVGAFTSKKRAIEYLNSLKLKGKVVEKNGIYRVLIGEFDSYKEAYKFMKEHSLKGFVRKVKN